MTGVDSVRQMREGARPAPAPEPAGEEQPPMRRHSGPTLTLPEDCPVVALGVQGKTCFYLDALGQLIELPWKDHSHNNIKGMFGSYSDLLEEYWPRLSKDGAVAGWRPEMASQMLMAAAATRGVWSPFDRVRGAGAWAGTDGGLALHCGDRILIVPAGAGRGKWVKPGLIGDLVYPTYPPTQRPADRAAPGGDGGPAAEVLSLFQSWSWRRGETDAMLLLGFVCAAKLGGALAWRPHVWITGSKHTGKSTLQAAVKGLLGEHGLLQSADATAAAVRQVLGYASLPVALDEAEADEDGRRMQALVKLARDAATGALAIRGGADHNASRFTLRATVMFASILLPPLMGQDRSRIAILELGPLAGTRPPNLAPARLDALGRALTRRLVDGWSRLAPTLEAYRQALADHGHSGRGADVFGTLLALADIALHDHEPTGDELAVWGERLKADTLAELEGDQSDEAYCLAHLMSQVIDPYRSGGRQSLAEWVAKAADRPPPGTVVDDAAIKDANRILMTYGLRVVGEPELRKLYALDPATAWEGATQYLAVANSNAALGILFAQTHWAGKSGTQGVWVQALRRLPGALVPPRPVWMSGAGERVAGTAARVTLVPLEAPA